MEDDKSIAVLATHLSTREGKKMLIVTTKTGRTSYTFTQELWDALAADAQWFNKTEGK